MAETKIEFKKRLTKEYKAWVDKVSDECDWKTHFTMAEICAKWSEMAWNEMEKEREARNKKQYY